MRDLVFHHHGLALKRDDQALTMLRLLGYNPGEKIFDPEQNVYVRLCTSPDHPAVEIVMPGHEGKSPIDSIIAKYDELIYHTCYETDNLEETLAAIARIRIANLARPVATKLQRILSAQSYRFPELFNATFEEGAGATISFLSDLFMRYNAQGQIKVTEPQRAAAAFLSLAVGGPARIIVSGNKLEDSEIEKHIRFAVDLFLVGVCRR